MRCQTKRFRKAQCPIIERLTNSHMMDGRNKGKKLMVVGIVKDAMEIIHLLTDANPIQIIVDVVINSGPTEDETRIGSAGAVRWQVVDISPLRHVNQAIYFLTAGACESAFRNVKIIVECLADELINATKGSSNRFPGDYEDPGVLLPDGFLERTTGIGKVIGWAPQVAVLAHRAVGGFVSHCGWNSLLESLWFGVPSATWLMYAEQQMNAFQMVVELGLAVEIKLDYNKDMVDPKGDPVIVTEKEIESGIKRVMEDNDVRTKVKEMIVKSQAAVAADGLLYAAVDHLIQDFIRNIS